MKRWIACLAVLAVAGCGGGGSNQAVREAEPATPPASSSSPTPSESAAPPPAPTKSVPSTSSPAKKPTPPKRAEGTPPLPTATAKPGAPPATGDRWIPRRSQAWQWQLSGPLDLSVDVPIYDVDGASTTAAQVSALHQKGRRVICYFNAGAAQKGDSYPESVLGKALEGWPDERWLDVRRLDVLEPIITRRIASCAAKGFDAVEPDNVDGYANDTGFPLTAAHQLAFNRMVAGVAHRHGLAVALKNDLAQVAQLEPAFDFAINEQCAEYGECAQLVPFVQAGKAVLHVEYNLEPAAFCAKTKVYGFSSMRKPENLGAARQPC
ncbi:endo alpha-1,4 polygalactosaminidase [Kribbella sp. DT2]|uniref:endo alpha-1,4 polygalactosaminidase n=1 Tax=Kribbella sp. DT2 TaxID=3393427 RepID=UPI003CED1F92